MTVTVETLEKLERKITLSVPVTAIQSEVDARLKKLTTGQATSLSMALKFRDPGLPEIIEKLEKTMRL